MSNLPYTKGNGDYLQLRENLDHVFTQALLTTNIGHHAHLLSQTRVKRLGHLLRLADATAFDYNVIKLLQLGKTDKLLEQVTA